jgi:hypothetical protein
MGSQLFGGGGGGGIKSIQRGTITMTGVTTNFVTITSVDVTNTRVRYLGQSATDAAVNTTERSFCYLTLTNATTLTVNRLNGTANVTVSYEVIEYYPGVIKSIQRGLISGGSSTATITSVDITKSELEIIGIQGDNSNFAGTVSVARLVLTNATTVTSTAGGAAGIVLAFQVTEWY